MIHPRAYQEEALAGIRQQLSKANSTLLVMATGLGKTVTFSQYAAEELKEGRVMVLAHREELIRQGYNHLKRITGVEPVIEMAEWHTDPGYSHNEPLILSTIQTQIAGMNGSGRMTKFKPEDFSLVIVDEAHHVPAKSYRRVIGWYQQNPNVKVLGVTATPDRADEKALGRIFETVAYEYGIKEGIEDGWLVPITQEMVTVEGLDYSNVRTTAGDLNGKDLAGILEAEENLHRIAGPTVELTGDKKTLIFTVTVAQAERLAEILNRHKPGSAEWVCGTTPKEQRRELFKRYEKSEFQYLVNVGVATEGFDCWSIAVIVQARPSKSRALVAQMIGRGTRVAPNTVDGLSNADDRRARIALSEKPELEVLDFVGNSGRHKLITTGDILGGNYDDDVVARAKKNVEKSGRGDMLTELELAEKQIAEEVRKRDTEAARRVVKLRALYSKAKVNPFDVLDITPARESGWNYRRNPTEKQIACLTKFGVDTTGLSFTHASQIIGRLITRRKKGKPSFGQTKVLRRFGYDVDAMTFTEASKTIDALAKNKWKPL